MADALDVLRELIDRLPWPEEDGAAVLPEGARSVVLSRYLRRGPLLVVTTRAAATTERAREIDFFSDGAGVVHVPPLFEAPVLRITPHPEAALDRVKALMHCLDGTARVALLDWKSFITPVEEPLGLIDRTRRWRVGDEIERGVLQDTLHSLGYRREDLTTVPGDYSFRGAVVDAYSPYREEPLRMEFEGDRIIMIRTFDPFTQLARQKIEEATLIPLEENRAAHANILDYLPGFRVLVEEQEQIARELEQWKEGLQRQIDLATDLETDDVTSPFLPRLIEGIERLEKILRSSHVSFEEFSTEGYQSGLRPQRAFQGLIEEWVKEARRKTESGRRLLVLLQSKGLAERVRELLHERHVAVADVEDEALGPGQVTLTAAPMLKGFEWPAFNVDLYSETDIFGPLPEAPPLPRRKGAGVFQSDLRDLKPGDPVTHVECGIGVFKGLVRMGIEGQEQEFMHLEYDGGDKLYVPVERMDLVEKYRAGAGAAPKPDRLGGGGWERTRKRVKKAVEQLAMEILNLYAERQLATRTAYGLDNPWQAEFEDAFEYDPTEDQAQAFVDVKADLQISRPMDRLICGDVGYGKTEVAMRAAMKVVAESRQVAVLAPTTVLAYQHWRTFTRRFEAFPVRVDLLSRYRSKAEQEKAVSDLAAGTVDIVIGTHRLLSKDVQFRDLGLLVIDEEQRFGVKHKERIKLLKKNVDVLALSATPIPRTLQMSLAGLRDMSVIETAPRDRLAIHTQVLPFDQEVIRAAVRFELGRGGQVFFVHNRIESLPALSSFIARLCPEARISVVHGQMGEHTLEEHMQGFVEGKTDVLLSTTIIENGLDIPRVNTLIVNRADRFGLAQLYQLRGRVGRSSRRAYAYLLVPPGDTLSAVAKKRLAALREFTELGAGFRIAAMDLELRGAGSLLGHRQHGHIEAVGFDMYCRMLERTVEELRTGRSVEEIPALTLNLGWDIRIPEAYVPDTNQRLQIYKRISSAQDDVELARLQAEVEDRYGRLPDVIHRLFLYGRIKAAAQRAGLQSIERRARQVVLRFPERPKQPPELILDVVKAQRAQIQPGGIVLIDAGDDPAGGILAFISALVAAPENAR